MAGAAAKGRSGCVQHVEPITRTGEILLLEFSLIVPTAAGTAAHGGLTEHAAFVRAVRALHRQVLPGEAGQDSDDAGTAETEGERQE